MAADKSTEADGEDTATPDFATVLALHRAGDLVTARTQYERIIARFPMHADALSMLGAIACQHGNFREADALIARSLALNPRNPAALTNRGVALHELRRYADAVTCFDQSLALAPEQVNAWFNRGNTLQEMGESALAIASYERGLAVDPSAANLHGALGGALLRAGELARGWPAYEWRWRDLGVTLDDRTFGAPRWRGDEPVAGKTILVHAEQGFGDTLQFARLCALVSARGARVVLEVQPGLMPLLAGLDGVAELTPQGAPRPACDYHCPLLSLPLALGLTLDDIPSAPVRVQVDPARVAEWRARVDAIPRPRIGLAWSGNPDHRSDFKRSIALSRMVETLPPHLAYVSLQPAVRALDEASLRASRIVHFGPDLRDFADTAALLTEVDLVVSVDTSVAHLAGALGRPVWLLLPFVPDWRWLLKRDDSPWYPTMRLYRQDASHRWRTVLARVAADLTQRFG